VSEPASATATFLFTDIEGSTALLKQLRQRYAEVLVAHHRVLREAFAAFGGREIDNQGDAFFVVFRRAREAVLAAAAAQRRLAEHEWPEGASVRVRIGIHTGEADLAGERYVGVSVHRAARISALGHGGQVLVSQTTAHLIEDEEDDLSGLRLRDLGEHRLKDLERPIRIYQLEVDGLRKDFPALASSAHTPRRRWLWAAAAVVGLLLIAGSTTAFVLERGGAPSPAVVPNSVVRLDPDTGKPTQVIPVGASPDLIVAAGGYVWVTHYIKRDTEVGRLRNGGDRTLTRVDPGTGKAVVVGGGLAPCGLTADPSGDVWVANCYERGSGHANVVRVDADTLRFKKTFSLPSTTNFFRGLAYGGGSLWASVQNRQQVYELDPETGKHTTFRAKSADGYPGALTWADGYGDLWWNYFDAGAVVRLEPESGEQTNVPLPEGFAPAFPASAGGAVWVADWNSPRVARIDAARAAVFRVIDLPGPHPQGGGVWAVAADTEHAWAATPRLSALWEISSETNAVTRIPFAFPPAGVTTSGNDVWVSVRARFR